MTLTKFLALYLIVLSKDEEEYDPDAEDEAFKMNMAKKVLKQDLNSDGLFDQKESMEALSQIRLEDDKKFFPRIQAHFSNMFSRGVDFITPYELVDEYLQIQGANTGASPTNTQHFSRQQQNSEINKEMQEWEDRNALDPDQDQDTGIDYIDYNDDFDWDLD